VAFCLHQSPRHQVTFFADKAGTTLNKLFNEFQENTLGNLVCKQDIRLDLFA
jgi:hypothetical protein